jgi:hypothetical protein
MRLLKGLAWVAFALAAVDVVIGVVMAFVPNPEGWAGGILFVVFYAAPLVLMGLALRSSHPVLHTIAGWAALLLAAYDGLIVVGNWSGYSSLTAFFAAGVTIPTVALYLIIFWVAALRSLHGVRLALFTYIRRTPSAFWIALVGVGFFLIVFLSGIWGSMSPFALVFLVPAYLLVAVSTAVHSRGSWIVACVVASLIALVEVGAALIFFTGNGTDKPVPEVAFIHTTGAVIAGAAAASALSAVINNLRSTGQRSDHKRISPAG